MAATRLPGVLSRRGWPQNPRRARGSAVGRPGSRYRQIGALVGVGVKLPVWDSRLHGRERCPAPQTTFCTTKGVYETASSPWARLLSQSCELSPLPIESLRWPSRRLDVHPGGDPARGRSLRWLRRVGFAPDSELRAQTASRRPSGRAGGLRNC